MADRSTVLIVDDEPSARDTLDGLLLQEGYNLAFACDGAEAMEKAPQLTQDAVLDIPRYVETPNTFETEPGQCSLAEIPDIVAGINDDLKIESLDVSYEGTELDDACVPLSRRGMELIPWELLRNTKEFHPKDRPRSKSSSPASPVALACRFATTG